MIDIEFSTIAFTIINLIVLFLLLKKFLIGPLDQSTMSSRREKI